MRLVMLALGFLGCASKDPPGLAEPVDTGVDYVPAQPWAEDSVAAPTVLAEDLDGPFGVLELGGSLYVTEQGAGRLVRIGDDGVDVIADGLDAPRGLAAAGDQIVVAVADAVRAIAADGEVTELFSGPSTTGVMVASDDDVWWLAGDEDQVDVWHARVDDPTAAAVWITDVREPGGMAVLGGAPLIVEGSSAQVLYAGAEPEEIRGTWSTELPGRDIAADCIGVVVTTESGQWPFPGWVATVGAHDPIHLSQTPPEPSHVALSSTHVYFASKQGIAAVSRAGGTYETIALRTSVADIIVSGDRLIWTDPDRGVVWAVDLAD
jgi:hypothetical protein